MGTPGGADGEVQATRRAGARHEVSTRVTLKALGGPAQPRAAGSLLEGWALNVSVGGIRVILEDRVEPGEEFEAENRLAFISERLRWHLSRHRAPDAQGAGANVADELRGRPLQTRISSPASKDTRGLGLTAPSTMLLRRSSIWGALTSCGR